ncbi:MAG TPA: PAS domain S-box protein [Polyangia bacterium]|nr:PAS domain S-box protein [Polyangia bacterium]
MGSTVRAAVAPDNLLPRSSERTPGTTMSEQQDDDLSWLDEGLRQSALEMLEVLFASSHVSLITFDADGTIVGVNPHMLAFEGRAESRYQGVNLLTNLIVRRLGWSDAIRRVLSGETVEMTDTRWVTIFSREERYVDVIAGPVMTNGKTIGGIAYLIDSTDKHRAEKAESAHRRRARELEAFLARDVANLIGVLEGWSRSQAPSTKDMARAISAIEELSTVLDDLLHFVQLGTYRPNVERILLADAVRGLTSPAGSVLETGGIAVMADRRLLRRVLRNLIQFGARHPAGPWSLTTNDGRVIIEIPVEGSSPWLKQLLVANPKSAAEAESADESLAAARWIAEALNGDLTASDRRQSLLLNLPAADAQLA